MAAAIVLALFAGSYVELRGASRVPLREWVLAVVVGWLVFGAWIAFSSGWAAIGAPRPFDPRGPDGTLDHALVATRLFAFVLVVPLMEELFWRSFLMRWIDARDFLARDPRRATWMAIGVSSALFASEHSLWFAGLIAGLAYAALYMRSRNLWIPIVSHATTNGTLALWILATRNWQLW